MKIAKELFLAIVVLAVTACGEIGSYITYDPVEMHEEPSDRIGRCDHLIL